MCTSPSPPQTPVTILDEAHTIEPALHSADTITALSQPDTASSSIQSLALPTHSVSTSRHTAISTMTAIQSQVEVQPNYPPQNQATASISANNPSCLTLPAVATSSHQDQPVKVPLDSGIVDPVSLSMKFRQSITPSFSFPGASSTATHDHIFPDSADSHCATNTPSSTEQISPTSQQTPNVYINGLPPHFSEQDLFALARPFGDIKSVRTFTRHVSEKPTGYGFVLFGDIDSAQRCIEGLRQYRNIHPSFSKVHRIPGTEYAQHCAIQSPDQDENSFKSRMEKLKDTSSTNLYIEGLPLSIDEESLSALVKPHKIKSSRFFKTKLSHPPRIIAFVRLETRLEAEETIERLHGRLVRGWNDPGCRISVRFADSAEQRELRRTERTQKNGDQSPSRLTIAQAALLNLRGQELQGNIHDPVARKAQRFVNPRSNNQAPLNPRPNCNTGSLPTSRSLPSKLCYPYRESPLLAASDLPSTSEMDTLLQSIQNGYEDGPLNSTLRSLALDSEYLLTRQAHLRALANVALLSPNSPPISLPRGHTQARNGFTPTEELILEAHAQQLHFQAGLTQSSSTFEPTSTLKKPNGHVQTFAPATQEPHQPSGLVRKGMLYQDTLPTITEDEFHAMGRSIRSFAPTVEFQGLFDNCPSNAPCTAFVPPPNRAVSIVPPPPDYEGPAKPKSGHQRTERLAGSKQIPCSSPAFNNRQSILSHDSESHRSLPHPSTRTNNMSDSSGDQRSTVKEGLRSPTVVSPALTYSSRTPSTLSPATPFFGSFVGGQDAFEVVTLENEEVAERTLKVRVANN